MPSSCWDQRPLKVCKLVAESLSTRQQGEGIRWKKTPFNKGQKRRVFDIVLGSMQVWVT